MTRIAQLLAFALALGAGIGTAAPSAQAQERWNDPRVADLVEAGEVRVALGLGTPMSAIKNPATGELRGLAIELGRALAQRIGVRFVPVVYPRPGAILDGLRDTGFYTRDTFDYQNLEVFKGPASTLFGIERAALVQ